MANLVERFSHNPILTPADVKPSLPGLSIRCVFNAGAFRYQARTGLLLRIAEFAPSDGQCVRVPVLDHRTGEVRIVTLDRAGISRSSETDFTHRGITYLTSLSHLRLAWSDDGEHFTVDDQPTLVGHGPLEAFGIEDCRTVRIGDVYHLTYTAVSEDGVGVGLMTTRDWQSFQRYGTILPPHNKDSALFPRKIDGQYICLHRPSGVGIGGSFMWIARSPDLRHWGQHQCIARTRLNAWDSDRIGTGAEPIETDHGWLCLYHASRQGRYCLGGMLLDKDDPSKVIARSDEPFMEPTEEYEKHGFVNAVIFTNGYLVDGDTITLYYGAADTVTCGARVSIQAILDSLT